MAEVAMTLPVTAQPRDADLLNKIADTLGLDRSAFAIRSSEQSQLEDASEILTAWQKIADPADRRTLLYFAHSLAKG